MGEEFVFLVVGEFVFFLVEELIFFVLEKFIFGRGLYFYCERRKENVIKKNIS